MFGFWVGAQYLLYWIVLSRVPPLDLVTLSNGGPSLTGNASYPTVFWFLFDLIVLTVVASGFRQLSLRVGEHARIGVGCDVAPRLRSTRGWGVHVDHWSLANFCIYIPLAWILQEPVNWRPRPFVIAFVVFTILELAVAWVAPTVSVLAVSGYARIALPFGATALFIWGNHTGEHSTLQWLGRYSLGIYALHDTLRILLLGLPALHVQIAGLSVTMTIVTSAAALGTTLLATWALSRTGLRALVA